MSVTAIPNGLSRPRERWSMRKAIYYRETATLEHDSVAARGDDAMASMTNLRILLHDVYTVVYCHVGIVVNVYCITIII